MKKIVITGHTNGLGKAMFDYFSKDLNNQVFGFSRSTGYNIKEPAKRKEITEFSKDADIFVNNADTYNDISQLALLRDMFQLWKGQNKLIINLSTTATHATVPNTYSFLKRGLDEFCSQKIFELPHIMNLKPGWVMVDRVKADIGDKPHMVTDEFIEILDYCLKSPVKVRNITFFKSADA